MSLALREQKGVFPKDADNVFLPAGRQVELILKSEDRVSGTAINDALFYLNPPIYGVQSGIGVLYHVQLVSQHHSDYTRVDWGPR